MWWCNLHKKVPLHPSERLARVLKQKKEEEFVKQVLLHPRERLKKKDKKSTAFEGQNKKQRATDTKRQRLYFDE